MLAGVDIYLGYLGYLGILGYLGFLGWFVGKFSGGKLDLSFFLAFILFFFSAGNWIYPSGKRTNPGPEDWEGFGRPWRRTQSREELPAGSFGVLWAWKPQNFTGGIFSSAAPRNDR